MKIKISSKFKEKLQKACKLIPSKAVIPILEYVHISNVDGTVRVRVTDLETTLQFYMFCDGVEDGACVVPAKSLLKAVTAATKSGVAYLEHKHPDTTIKAGTKVFTIKSDNVELDDFPKMPDPGDRELINNIGFHTFLRSCELVLPFADSSKDDLRPALKGIYFHEGNMVATDGNRLAVKKYCDREKDRITALLPRTPIRLFYDFIKKSEPEKVQLSKYKYNAVLETADITIITRLIDDRYPNYKAAIPENANTKILLKSKPLSEVLHGLMDFANKTTYQVVMNVSDGEARIKAEDIDLDLEANDCIPAAVHGDAKPIEVAYSCKYMKEIIKLMDADFIDVHIEDSNRPLLIYPVREDSIDKSEQVLLMPIMLNQS